MRHYEWNEAKNELLKTNRAVSFEEVLAAITSGHILDDKAHTNKAKYPHQRILVVSIEDYIYLVPYVEKDEQTLFLKTIIPSRVATKHYLKGGKP